MKFLLESGESQLIVYRDGDSVVLELNGQKMAIEGNNLVEFDNLIGNLAKQVAEKKSSETPLIKKLHRIWTNTN